MSLALIQQPAQHQIILSEESHARRVWFPNLQSAYDAVIEYYETLPSASNPKDEQFSQRDCRILTHRFMQFCMDHQSLPDDSLMNKYVGQLMANYAHKTIVKYMVYARHFCKALARQPINPEITDREYRYVNEIRQGVINAASRPNPKKKSKVANEGSAYATGKRLSMEEAQSILNLMGDDLTALRDRALLLAGFATGLRLSELARITLNSITETSPGVFAVTVRAKGNKYSPRAINRLAVTAINTYVDAYNSQLPSKDARRIERDNPIWRPLTRTGNIFNTPPQKMTPRGLSKIIDRRSLAPDPLHHTTQIAAHDLRRTWAAWAESLGMPENDIQEQMLHETITQTRHYIARPRDVASQDIFKYGLSLQ